MRQQKLFKDVERKVEQLQQQLVEPIKSLSHLADGYVERFLRVVRVRRLGTPHPRLRVPVGILRLCVGLHPAALADGEPWGNPQNTVRRGRGERAAARGAK